MSNFVCLIMKSLSICIFALFSNILYSQEVTVSKDFEDIGSVNIPVQINNINILDSTLQNFRVFLSGENHSLASYNSDIEVSLMKYLNEEGNVRNLVLELGFARGYMLDKYINDDSTYFDLLKDNTSYVYLNFYRRLRELNQSLDEDKRIRVHGIDVERFPDDAPILLDKLLPIGKEIPEKIALTIESLRSYAQYSKIKYRSYSDKTVPEENDEDYIPTSYDYSYYTQFNDEKVIDTLLADFKRYSSEIKLYIGADSILFESAIQSLIDYRIYDSYSRMPQEYVYRERYMFANFKKLLLNNPDQKYFGQFGRCHVSLTETNYECEWWAFNSLAKRLNESEFKNSVMSLGIYYTMEYINSYNYSDIHGQNDSANEQISSYLKRETEEPYNLYKIEDQDSVLKRYYQYVIVCKSSFEFFDTYSKNFHQNSAILSFGVSNNLYDFKALNTALFPGYEGFNPMVENAHFSFGGIVDNRYFNFSFNYNFPQYNREGNNRYTLSGFSVFEKIGGSILPGKRWSFTPSLVFGYTNLKLRVRNDSLSETISPGFSTIKDVTYRNNAIVLGPSFQISYAIARHFAVFVNGVYLFDWSNKLWKRKNGIFGVQDKQSPKTNVGYLGLSAGISFLFQD